MVSTKIKQLSEQVIRDITPQLSAIDDIAQLNTEKVHRSFSRNRVDESCFAPTTGYGYNDKGRETLNRVFADIMATQDALVSGGFVSGTHAITSALFAASRPGMTLLSVTGKPYDTLHGVIGLKKAENGETYKGSLNDYNISYEQINLINGRKPDINAITKRIKKGSICTVFIQRSRGYKERSALNTDSIAEICKAVRDADKEVIIVVDNCYGEFVETIEPTEIGADIIAGSLIKNPGGGIVPKGGYVAGKQDLVEAAAARLTAPGIGAHCGAATDGYRLLFQGLFMAPHIVAQALKTAVFGARLFQLLGYRTDPMYDEARSDIIQMIGLKSPELLKIFCRGIQSASPVDSYVTPVSAEMPGYDSPVIMAAGTFVQGASIELSADAPMCEPYNVFMQGALTFESGKHSLMLAATSLSDNT